MFIENLYVRSEFRGKGIGEAMMRELCRIAVSRGYKKVEWHCLEFNHNHKKPGITFRKEKLGKNLGEVIGFAPLKDDLTGVREDMEYDFLQVEPEVVISGHEEAGTMQRLTLKTACD